MNTKINELSRVIRAKVEAYALKHGLEIRVESKCIVNGDKYIAKARARVCVERGALRAMLYR